MTLVLISTPYQYDTFQFFFFILLVSYALEVELIFK